MLTSLSVEGDNLASLKLLEKTHKSKIDLIYIESWGPKYEGLAAVKHWFHEWNTCGKVVVWDIKQFFHKGNQTIVEWYFKDEMNNGQADEFDGISLIEWTTDNKIRLLKEYGCNLNN